MSFEWREKVVVVTGASAGIGAALAREVGRRGASVALAARRIPELEAVAAGIERCAVVRTDVTRRSEVEGLLRATIDRFGHVDVWVNNAGRGISRQALELTDADVDTMITDNVKSALYGMQVAIPHFRERGRGHLVNVSSMLGRIPFASIRAAYCAAKHALNSLTESVRMDLANDFPGVRVTCVMPGVVSTDFGKNALHGGPDSRSFPQTQTAEQVASIIAEAVTAGNNGDVYTVPGAIDRVIRYYGDLARQP